MSVAPSGGFNFSSLGSVLGGVGSLIGGASSLFGGGQNNNWLAEQQFNQAQNQAWNMQNAQEQFQREVGQNSIQWRVGDAKAAGISPLAALGAPTFSPSISVGNPSPNVSGGIDRQLPDLSRMGANLGDIIGKTMTAADKTDLLYKTTIQGQQIQNNDLELQIKTAQLARLNKLLQTPGAADVNGGDGMVRVIPDRVVSAASGDPSSTAGVHPDTQINQSAGGGYRSTYATPTNPSVNANPSITNPFLWQWAYNRYVDPALRGYNEWFDRNFTNPMRSWIGLEPYQRR